MGGMSAAGDMGGGSGQSEYFGGKYINVYSGQQDDTASSWINPEYWDPFKKGNAAFGYIYDATKDTTSASAFEKGDFANVNWRYLKDQGWSLEEIQKYHPGIIELSDFDKLPDNFTLMSEMNPLTASAKGKGDQERGAVAPKMSSRGVTITDDTVVGDSFGSTDRPDRTVVTMDNLGVIGAGNREGIKYDENGNAYLDVDYFTEAKGWKKVEPMSRSGYSQNDESGTKFIGSGRKQVLSQGSSQNMGKGALANQIWGWLKK